jgi:hypothetical protein
VVTAAAHLLDGVRQKRLKDAQSVADPTRRPGKIDDDGGSCDSSDTS